MLTNFGVTGCLWQLFQVSEVRSGFGYILSFVAGSPGIEISHIVYDAPTRASGMEARLQKAVFYLSQLCESREVSAVSMTDSLRRDACVCMISLRTWRHQRNCRAPRRHLLLRSNFTLREVGSHNSR